MRIRITKPKIYGENGVPLPVGTELDLPGPLPEGWKSSVIVLSESVGKTPVTNEDDPEDGGEPENTLAGDPEDDDTEGDSSNDEEAPQRRSSRRRR